jgi:hypothetical protein
MEKEIDNNNFIELHELLNDTPLHTSSPSTARHTCNENMETIV